ncbi:MAG: serine hydrolase domain-containing protein [Salinivirgaceae bacterium]
MNVFKDTKLLIIWWAVASVTAFCFYNPNENNSAETNIKKTGEFDGKLTFSNAQKEKLAQYFEKLYHKKGFNGVVLIGQKDSIFYQASYGWANYHKKDSLTMNSSFQLASVSKQFTAVAILQLYEKGKLKLTDSIEKFYPNFPHKGITIHQLLTHRSGLPNYNYFLQDISSRTDTLISCQYVIQEIIANNIPLYHRPNRRYQYSNTGYAVLAAIVERVSGLPFEIYIEQELFKPLGMNESFVYRGIESHKKKGSTKGYIGRWREATDNHLDGVLGDKGIYCSAIDLFKWDQGLYKNILLNNDSLQLAFQPMGKPAHFNSNYGYGWRMIYWPTDSLKVLYHAGWWHGYRTLLMHIPKDTVTIVVLKNRSASPNVNSKTMLNILYPVELSAIDTLETELNEQ